jgi:hypothetical protein
MKNAIVSLLLVFVTGLSSKAQTQEWADSHIAGLFERMDYWCQYCYNDKKDRKVDSLRNAGGKIYDFIENIIVMYPYSLAAELPQAKEKGLHYVTSDDGELRIYSWEAKMEGHVGTPRYEFRDVAGFKTDMGRKYHDISNGTEGAYCTNITTLHTKKGITLYLANYYTYQNGIKTEKIRAYAILDNKISEMASFMKETKNPKQLWCDYTVSLDQLRNEKSEIHFSKDKTRLYVPVTEKNGNQYDLTGKYSVFVFNGFMFVYEKNAI